MKKPSRNASCPCGSGIKYKKCCLQSAATPEKESIHHKAKKSVRSEVMASLSGEQALSPLMVTQKTNEYALEGAELGRNHDLDAVCMIERLNGILSLAIVVGRSVLFGDSAYDLIVRYHDDNANHVSVYIDFVIEELERYGLPKGEPMLAPIREKESEKWRSFRDNPLKSIDEIYERVTEFETGELKA